MLKKTKEEIVNWRAMEKCENLTGEGNEQGNHLFYERRIIIYEQSE